MQKMKAATNLSDEKRTSIFLLSIRVPDRAALVTLLSDAGIELVNEKGVWSKSWSIVNQNDIALAVLMKKVQLRIGQLELDLRERELENALLRSQVEQQAVEFKNGLVSVASTVTRSFNAKLAAATPATNARTTPTAMQNIPATTPAKKKKEEKSDKLGSVQPASANRLALAPPKLAAAPMPGAELAQLIQSSILSALAGSQESPTSKDAKQRKRRRSPSVELVDSATSDEEPAITMTPARKRTRSSNAPAQTTQAQNDDDSEVQSKYICLGPWTWPLRPGARAVHYGQVRDELQKGILTLGTSASKVPRAKNVHAVANPNFVVLEWQDSDEAERFIKAWAKRGGDWMPCTVRRMLKSEVDDIARGTFTS